MAEWTHRNKTIEKLANDLFLSINIKVCKIQVQDEIHSGQDSGAVTNESQLDRNSIQ